MLDDLPHAWKAIKPKPSIKGHHLREPSLDWVNSLLKTCLQSHNTCPSTRVSRLPRRVLAFHASPEGHVVVKLQEDVQGRGQYAALSHCWGEQQTCTTTKYTLEQRKTGITWEHIPQTFQDSIVYCLKLGINHLWIDALCILQDDVEDWQSESAKMADIYQNSYITLAATVAKDSNVGCWTTTEETRPEYELSAVPESFPRVLVRERLYHWTDPLTDASMSRYPLISRGWVFQERILSPRILHFCGQELVWECGGLTACECGCIDPKRSIKQQFVSATSRHRRKSWVGRTGTEDIFRHQKVGIFD